MFRTSHQFLTKAEISGPYSIGGHVSGQEHERVKTLGVSAIRIMEGRHKAKEERYQQQEHIQFPSSWSSYRAALLARVGNYQTSLIYNTLTTVLSYISISLFVVYLHTIYGYIRYYMLIVVDPFWKTGPAACRSPSTSAVWLCRARSWLCTVHRWRVESVESWPRCFPWSLCPWTRWFKWPGCSRTKS